MKMKTKLLNILNTFSFLFNTGKLETLSILTSFSIKTLISILLHKPYIIIYPGFLTILLLLLRYIRLGNTIEIVNYYNISLISNLLLIAFFWPYISVWLRLIIWKIKDIRLAMWNDFITILTLIHTYLLQFDLYFYIVSRLHKLAFLWLTFITNNGLIYPNQSKTRILIHKSYLYPVLSTIILWIICLLELIITAGHLKYSLYFMFIFVILRIIISSINEFALSNWPYHVCISDYIYQRWDKPRYPTEFWCQFDCFANTTEIHFDISNQVQQKIDAYILFYESKRNITKKSMYKLIANKKIKYNVAKSIRFTYYNWYQIRWTHTETIHKFSTIWHPMISLFARNATDYAAAMNNHWLHYHTIEQAKKAIPYKQIIYENFPPPKTNLSKISKVIEHNLLTNFHPLQQLNITVSTFYNTVIRNTFHQPRDDIIISTIGSQVQDARIHGLDQKAISPSQIKDPSSTILSQISIKDYRNIILQYQRLLHMKNRLSAEESLEVSRILDQLIDTCDNLPLHQVVWAQHLHLFPDNAIPPLRVPHNFATQDFPPEIHELLRQSNIYMQKVSNHLYTHKVPCDYKQAIEFMDNAFVQNMFEEVEK